MNNEVFTVVDEKGLVIDVNENKDEAKELARIKSIEKGYVVFVNNVDWDHEICFDKGQEKKVY